MLELADETFHLALRYLDTFLLRRGASPGFRVADCFFFSFLLFSARRRHRASPLSDASPSLFFFETSFSLGPENFLARNGAGSEPVPALPLGALPCDRALYLDGQHQPLCNKLKRLGITCVFVAAKVVEVCAPPAGEFAHAAEVSTFSRSQLLLAERALLRELEYDLYHPTCSSFATAYVAASADDIASNARAPRATRVWIEERESGGRGSGPRLGSEPLVTSTNGGVSSKGTTLLEESSSAEEQKACVSTTAAVVEYVLEAAAVARDGVAFAPSKLAAAAVSWTLSRCFSVRDGLDALPTLRKVSGYTEADLSTAYAFFDKVVVDFRDARERKARGGFFADEKHAKAVRAVWRERHVRGATMPGRETRVSKRESKRE
jgi:hypothetical protein